MTSVRWIVLLGAVVVVIATLAALRDEAPRDIGSNGIFADTFGLSLAPAQEACQRVVPPTPGTDAIRITAATYGRRGGRIRARIPGRGAASAVAIDPEGVLVVPAPAVNDIASQRLCLANAGAVRIALGGQRVARGQAARIGTRPTRGVFAAAYLHRERQRWSDRVGAILTRTGYAKGLPGGRGTGAAVVALLVLTIAVALVATSQLVRVRR